MYTSTAITQSLVSKEITQLIEITLVLRFKCTEKCIEYTYFKFCFHELAII